MRDLLSRPIAFCNQLIKHSRCKRECRMAVICMVQNFSLKVLNDTVFFSGLDVYCTSSQGKEAGLQASSNCDGAGFTAIIKLDQNVVKWSHISAVDIPKGGAPINQRIA